MKLRSALTVFVLFFLSSLYLQANEIIRVLAIGNSFSRDAVEFHLHQLARNENITVIIGNMYIGGCSLSTHWTNASGNKPAYSYRKINAAGVRSVTENISLETAIQDEQWDYITFQQASPNSGQLATYFPYLSYLIDYVKGKATNPQVKYLLHQTWAYEQTSTHDGFNNYGNDQLQMYNAIIEAVHEAYEQVSASVDRVIPAGTAIQNGRTSIIGDNFCIDGFHLNSIGRYTAACTWLEVLTGRSAVGNSYFPSDITEIQAEICQKSANYAAASPWTITTVSVEEKPDEDIEYNTQGDGTLSDQNIQYIGRWDKGNANYYHGHWAAASIRVDFTGTSIKINLENQSWIYLVVQIDGETPRAVLAQNGTNLNLNTLTEGRHTIVVGAAIGGSEVLFKGFTLDFGAVTYKPRKKLLIEFIGDSITESGGPGGMFAYNYAWRLANRLDCDHTQIASSAIALCSGYSIYESDRVGMDSLYFGLKNYKYSYDAALDPTFVPWDFSTYTPDIVFTFLGTNDSDGVPWIYNATNEVFSERLDKFLKRIRGKFPNAYITVMNPFTGVFKNVIDSKIKELRASGETKLYFINSTGWLNANDFSDGIHPTEQGTVKMINNLYSIFNPMVQSIKDGTEYEGPEDPEEPDTTGKFYLIPSTDWLSANATFAGIFKNGTAEEKVAFSLNSTIGMYELSIPAGTWTQISARRYAPNGVGDWGGFATLNDGVYSTNFIPYDGSYNCIEVIGWADGTNPDGYILSTYPVNPASGITIRFKKPASWPVVNIHAWDATGVPLPGFNWPGNPMLEDSANQGWYYYTFDPSVQFVSFQFNKGDAEGLIVKEAVTESTSYNEDGSINNGTGTSVIQPADILSVVYAANNQLIASFTGTANIKLYSVTGQLLHAETASDKFVCPVNRGIYLININGKTHKALVP